MHNLFDKLESNRKVLESVENVLFSVKRFPEGVAIFVSGVGNILSGVKVRGITCRECFVEFILVHSVKCPVN